MDIKNEIAECQVLCAAIEELQEQSGYGGSVEHGLAQMLWDRLSGLYMQLSSPVEERVEVQQ